MAVENKNRKHKSDAVKKDNRKTFKVIVTLSSLLIAVASYKFYEAVTNVPDLPELDLNVWWGHDNERTDKDTSIRSFRMLFSDAMQEELNKKFDFYRRTEPPRSLNGTASSYGMNSDVLKQIVEYWLFEYNIKKREKFFNKYDQFKSNIQGLDIHYVHVKPKVAENVQVLPILLLHGWPSSIREFYEVIPLLTAEKSEHDFVFEVIAPSLPGFAYSQATRKQGLCPYQIAIIMRNLMHRIGFKQYYLQGGDFGHIIASNMATIFPNEVLGFHSNFPVNFSKMSVLTWILGGIWPTLIEDKYADRMYPLKDKVGFVMEESGYVHMQGTKPDTIGIALQDSPVGLAAYLLDRFLVFTDPNNKHLPDSGISKFSLTNLLDHVMLYWTTNSITTSMRLYKESFSNAEMEQVLSRIPTSVPMWGLRLKHEFFFQPEFMLRWKHSWKYPNLHGTTTVDFGGHYAAFEKPDQFADDVFLAVKSFRMNKI